MSTIDHVLIVHPFSYFPRFRMLHSSERDVLLPVERLQMSL